MKSYYTIIIAAILFGLCLLEKDLKQRAMNEQFANQVVKSTNSAEKTTTKQSTISDNIWARSIHVSDISTPDSLTANENGRIQASL